MQHAFSSLRRSIPEGIERVFLIRTRPKFMGRSIPEGIESPPSILSLPLDESRSIPEGIESTKIIYFALCLPEEKHPRRN